ncbi:MAG: OpgC domain-containing protein [Acetobacteraceae bacterium]|nr:OpgC domain-containing protein [Acetobacteraceae bacterium]
MDLFRGYALLAIFIDHVPGNFLGLLTLHIYGFSDAAEIFVLLAGFASMMAYGHSFAREGTVAGLKRIALRCVRLYAFHVCMLLATVVIVRGWWLNHYELAPLGPAPILTGGSE